MSDYYLQSHPHTSLTYIKRDSVNTITTSRFKVNVKVTPTRSLVEYKVMEISQCVVVLCLLVHVVQATVGEQEVSPSQDEQTERLEVTAVSSQVGGCVPTV